MRLRLRNIAGKELYPLTGLIKQIGRGMDCDIVISDPQVSRLHARLEKAGEGWVIVDLESRNGTRVNGDTVAEKMLNTGDMIQIGGASLKYEIDDESDEPGENTRTGIEQPDSSSAISRFFSLIKKK